MLPNDAAAAEFAQDLDDAIRPRPQRRHVAKADDLVHTGPADLSEHRSQRHFICVDVRNQGDARHLDPHRPGDVLYALLAPVLEGKIELVPDLVPNDPARTDPARLG